LDQRFYATDIEEASLLLEDQEAKHCAQVLRKQVGDTIAVLDGKGNLYSCSIQKITKAKVECDIQQKTFYQQSENLILAVAPPKNRDRLEWMVEKLVEIGIKKLILFTSQNSERSRINLDRLQKKMLSATKQSLRYYVPVVEEKSFKEVLITTAQNRCIAHCKPSRKLKPSKTDKETIVLIGPEGDFTADEIQQAEDAGFKAVDLGAFRLRTETAAIVAATQF
jgi:16S rRNA (uracil1498-N3)-methyltransferase